MPLPDPYTILTWNVRYFGHGLKGLRVTENSLRQAAAALASVDPFPDIIALQEVETRSLRAGLHPERQLSRFMTYLHRALDEAGRRQRYVPLYFPAHRYHLGKGPAIYTTGLAFLVGPRLRVLHENTECPQEITFLRRSWARPLKQKRILAHIQVQPFAGGIPVDVYNTHLSLPAFFEVGPHRIPSRMGHGSNQQHEADRILTYLSGSARGPLMLMGDFNTRPGSPTYERFLRHGLEDVFVEHAPRLLERELEDHATAGFGPVRMHIDHVFASPQLRWHRLFAPRYGDAHLFSGISDHTPKMVSLLWPEAEDWHQD